MFIPFLKFSFRRHALRGLTSLVFLFGFSINTAYAGNVWQGVFHSNARNESISVLLTLPSDGKSGELRFVTLACAVGLQTTPQTTVYLIAPQENAVAGQYCGAWLGGSLEIRPAADGKRLGMTVTRRQSKIVVNNLVPAPESPIAK